VSEPRLVYVESSVFLALVKGEEGRIEDCRAVAFQAEAGEITVVTSPFTLAEVAKTEGVALAEDVEREISLFFNHEWIHLVELDRLVATRARKVIRDFNLKPPDAVHVASAVNIGATLLLTYDKDLLRIGRIENMEIRQPAGQRPFDFADPRQ